MDKSLIFLSSLTSQFLSFLHWTVFDLFFLLRDSENNLFMSSLQANLRPKSAIFPTLFMSY